MCGRLLVGRGFLEAPCPVRVAMLGSLSWTSKGGLQGINLKAVLGGYPELTRNGLGPWCLWPSSEPQSMPGYRVGDG